MKVNIALVLSIIVAVGIVAFGFTAVQIASEKEKLNSDLQAKTIRTAEEFYTRHLAYVRNADTIPVALTDSIIRQYDFCGSCHLS